MQSIPFASLLSTLADDSLTRGKQFERLVKWCSHKTPFAS